MRERDVPTQKETIGVLKILFEIAVCIIVAQKNIQKKDSSSNQHLIGPMIGLEILEACNTLESTKQQQTMIGEISKNDLGSIRQLLHSVVKRYKDLVNYIVTLGLAKLMNKLERKMMEKKKN